MKRVVKSLVLFVAIASMASMTSCMKESDIIGTWKLDTIKVQVKNVDYGDAIAQILQTQYMYYYKDMMWVFYDDNTMSLTGANFDENSMINLSNAEKFPYSIKDGRLIIVPEEEGHLVEFDIDALNRRRLDLSIDETTESGARLIVTFCFIRV